MYYVYSYNARLRLVNLFLNLNLFFSSLWAVSFEQCLLFCFVERNLRQRTLLLLSSVYLDPYCNIRQVLSLSTGEIKLRLDSVGVCSKEKEKKISLQSSN